MLLLRRGYKGTTMRNLIRILAIVLLAGGILAACDSYEDDIAAVKAAETTSGGTNEDFANQLAGARGKVTWAASEPEAYKDNPDIVMVTATIEKTATSGAKRVVVLEYLNNGQTRKIALERVLVDGQPQGLVSGMLNLLLLQLE
jgi:hypothetical protein